MSGDRLEVNVTFDSAKGYRFPLIVAALNRLRSHSCITDGDAVDGLG